MKKFTDARAPLTMLKFKMQIKARKMESYKIFHEELETMVDEQNKFFASCEMDVALAEMVDPVQVIIFESILLWIPTMSLSTQEFSHATPYVKFVSTCMAYISIYIYIYTYICICICIQNQINTHTGLLQFHNHKNVFQGDESEFDEQLKVVAKKTENIAIHCIGNQISKKRFEAMLA